MPGAVDGQIGQIEADDLVVGKQRLGGQGVEDSYCNSLIPACPHRGVRHFVTT